MIFILMYRIVMGLAAVGVINAVFMQETFKVVNNDSEIMVMMKARAISRHKRKMQDLFSIADTDGSGKIQRHEFKRVIGHQTIKTWLASMELDVNDADILFDELSGEDQEISLDELVAGISSLKGPARCIDMRALLKDVESVLQQANLIPSTSA